jgi:hypothetical protein
MKNVEVIFDGKDYYIMSHRDLGLGVFAGHARYEWTKKHLKIDKLQMVSKDVFEVLKKKHGSIMIKE